MGKIMFRVLLAVSLVAILAGCGNSAEQQAEVSALRAELDKVKELQGTIARHVGLGELARPEAIAFERGTVLGDANAKVAIIEFTDLHCPFCKRFNDTIFPELQSKYIDTGKIQFVGREFPLQNLHPNAGMAAVALRCASQQAPYLTAKAVFFADKAEFTSDYLDNIGEKMQIEQDAFAACLKNSDVHSVVSESMQYANMLGLKATPAFFIGIKQGDAIIDYQLITGAKDMAFFTTLIEEMLDKVK